FAEAQSRQRRRWRRCSGANARIARPETNGVRANVRMATFTSKLNRAMRPPAAWTRSGITALARAKLRERGDLVVVDRGHLESDDPLALGEAQRTVASQRTHAADRPARRHLKRDLLRADA